MKNLKTIKIDQMNFPLEEVTLNDDELLVIRGGTNYTSASNGRCNCNCSCGSSNGRCDCNCSCLPTQKD